MLAPDGRAVLLDALRPPAGFVLGRAVATTFTLDLTAALVAPLAFARSQLGDSKDPVAVMEAVMSCRDRVDVFCQAGQVAVPRQLGHSDLYELIDSMIHTVRRPRPGHLFHPKLWVLRFEAEGVDDRYRVLVLTRNLTLDRSWDLVLRLDQDGARRRNSGNDQLVSLIEALPTMATDDISAGRVEAIRGMARELRYVGWELPDDVVEIGFWAYGIGRRTRPSFRGYRHLVVSPFLTPGGLDHVLEDANGDVHVVSRTEELDKLPADVFEGFSVHALDPLVGYGDPDEAGPVVLTGEPATGDGVAQGGVSPGLHDLHAKLVVAERDRRAHLFVGSANVTDAAFGGNVEVLCELIGGATKLGVDAILDAAKGMGGLLQVYEPGCLSGEDDDDALERRLDEALRAAAEARYTALVNSAGSDAYTVALSSDRALCDDAELVFAIAPLNRSAERWPVQPSCRVEVFFGPRGVADLTSFYVVTVSLVGHEADARSTVVRASLVGAPPDRLDQIVARQFDTVEKFLRFVMLLLGAASDATTLAEGVSGGARSGEWRIVRAGVLELLANALASRPQRIDDLAGVVRHVAATPVGRRILPEGWDTLWSNVLEARRRLEGSA